MPVFAELRARLIALIALPALVAVIALGGTLWWAWLSIATAAAALGGAGWLYRRGQAQEPPIRRQLARESSLKARLDDLFERTSEILVVHERRGFTVIAAEDGRAALEMFTTQKDRIDVIVTDVVMPRMNGADLAKAVEKIQPGVKLLFILGHPDRAGAGLNPTGVTNLLMKPFTADTLATRIKELIAAKPQGAERG